MIDEIRFENQIIDEKPKKKINFFNFFIVIIISLIAVIIILDTFKYSISTIFPNIEILLDTQKFHILTHKRNQNETTIIQSLYKSV